MPQTLAISVILPCFNEAGNIERTISKAHQVLEQIAPDHEILLINDGSHDDTGAIAERLALEFPRLRVVHNPQNLGYGGALKRGFTEARKEWIFWTDGDGQFDLHDMSALLQALAQNDVVTGYRLHRRESPLRRFNGWAWTRLMNLLFDLHLRDVDCAFKIFPRHLLEQVRLESSGALISAELLAKAHYLGYRIAEVGVHHYPRLAGKPTGANLRVIVRAFRELLNLRVRIRSTGIPEYETV